VGRGFLCRLRSCGLCLSYDRQRRLTSILDFGLVGSASESEGKGRVSTHWVPLARKGDATSGRLTTMKLVRQVQDGGSLVLVQPASCP
jgi:hypothetical protein